MLYMDNDGRLVIDDRPLPKWALAYHEQQKAERMAENEERYRKMCEQVAELDLLEKLEQAIDELAAFVG